MVTLYLGQVALEIAKEMELDYYSPPDNVENRQNTKADSTPLILEGGVWKN